MTKFYWKCNKCKISLPLNQSKCSCGELNPYEKTFSEVFSRLKKDITPQRMNYSKETLSKLSKSEFAIQEREFNYARKCLFMQKPTKCEECKSEENIHVHHKDRNRSNNNLSNLKILCSKCHAKEHSKLSRIANLIDI